MTDEGKRDEVDPNHSSALPVFPWFIERFYRSPQVRGMDGFERGVFLQLLGEEWVRQGEGLPNEEWQLQALVFVSPEDWQRVRGRVLGAFTESEEGERGIARGRLYHPTCEDAIQDALTKRRRARENGRKGGRPKIEPDGDGSGDERRVS